MPVKYISDQTPIRDVVLMPDHRHEAGDESVFQEPTFDTHVGLGYDIEITPVGEALAKRIRTACDPAHQNHAAAIELRSTLYAFVRYDAPRDQLYHWDPDRRLQEMMALSRLVHPTSISFEFAARIIGDPLSETSVIIAGPVKGNGSHAWVTNPRRNWLSPTHVPAVTKLYDAFQTRKDAITSRVRRAMWYHEYAARSYEVDVRCTFVATALEALVNTGAERSTAQFVHRVPQLAADCDVKPPSKRRATKMYGLRSSIVHGRGIAQAEDEVADLYFEMEALLRATTRRAILDSAFDAIFASAQSVDQRYPLPAKSKGAV